MMALQISVFLLSILFTAGHSLYCYQCTDLTESCVKKPVVCPWSATKCASSTIVLEIDPNKIAANGKTCYYCDGDSCSNILSCSGTEDRCITATKAVGGQDTVVKGCVSKVICDSKTLANTVQDVSCCEGNLCNGDESVPQSVTQSFIQNVTQSFMYNSDESVTQSFIQSVTQSFVYDNVKIVKHNDAKSAMYSNAKSAKKSFMYNNANSVSQSFLFLCCSLLSFILLH